MPSSLSSSRTIAAVLLLVVAVIPGGVWILFLMAPAGGARFIQFVASAHGELKGVLVLMAASAAFSLAAAIAVAMSRRPMVPRGRPPLVAVQGAGRDSHMMFKDRRRE